MIVILAFVLGYFLGGVVIALIVALAQSSTTEDA